MTSYRVSVSLDAKSRTAQELYEETAQWLYVEIKTVCSRQERAFSFGIISRPTRNAFFKAAGLLLSDI